MASKKRGVGDPVRLRFQVLVGAEWRDAQPQHVRKGHVFRCLLPDGTTYKAARRMVPHVQDAGVYVATANGDEHGAPFDIVPSEPVQAVAPALAFDAD